MKTILFCLFSMVSICCFSQSNLINENTQNFSQLWKASRSRGQFFSNPKQEFYQIPNSTDVLALSGGSRKRLRKNKILWDNNEVYFPNIMRNLDGFGRTLFVELGTSSFYHFWDSNFPGGDRVLYFEELNYEGAKIFETQKILEWDRDINYLEAILSGYNLSEEIILTVFYNSTYQAPPDEKLVFFNKDGTRLNTSTCPISFEGKEPFYHKISDEEVLVISVNGSSFILNINDRKAGSANNLGGTIYGFETIENVDGFFVLFKDKLVHFDNSLQEIEQIAIEEIDFALECSLASNNENVFAIYGNKNGKHHLQKLNYNGGLDLAFQKNFDSPYLKQIDASSLIKMDPNDNFYLFGVTTNDFDVKGWELIMVDEQGEKIQNFWGWETYRGPPRVFERPEVSNAYINRKEFYASIYLDTGGVGVNELETDYVHYFTDGHFFEGLAFGDTNKNCENETTTTEQGLPDVQIEFFGANNFYQKTISDFWGRFYLVAPVSIFEIDSLEYKVTFNGIANESCKEDLYQYSNAIGSEFEFPIQESLESNLSITVSNDNEFWLACERERINVSIKNTVFSNSMAGELIVKLNPFVEFIQSNFPVSKISNDSVFFEIDVLSAFESIELSLDCDIDCDAPLGEDLCIDFKYITNSTDPNFNPDPIEIELCKKEGTYCPELNQDIFGPSNLTKCNKEVFYFESRNLGDRVAENVKLEIELDSIIQVFNLDHSDYSRTGNLVKVNLGDMEPSRISNRIRANVGINCDSPLSLDHLIKTKLYSSILCPSVSNEFKFGFSDPIEGSVFFEEETQSISNHHISIFPNPSNNQINFIFEKSVSKPVQFELYNLAGQKVLFREVNGDFVIDKSEIGTGVFFFELKEGRGDVESGKLIFID